MKLESIGTYEQWSKNIDDYLSENFKLIDCINCNGAGSIICDCNCPHCENVDDCEHCDGDGYYYDGVKVPVKNEINWAAAVINDIKLMCVFTGRDFLSEVCPAVKYFRANRIRFHLARRYKLEFIDH
jgi:excinuclease UvrABC ATPase subunit